MKVTLIGTGNMGSGLAKHLANAGHTLVLAGRNTEKGQALALASHASFKTSDAAAGADVVIVATAYADAVSALRAAGDLDGKVVIDISNPLTADYMGLTIGHGTSAGEEIQKSFPKAKVVKAFNTVFAQVLAAGPSLAGETVPVYVAGNDAAAKEKVSALIKSIGFAPVDAGGLRRRSEERALPRTARRTEHLLWLRRGQGNGHRSQVDRHSVTDDYDSLAIEINF
jgi:predicted dinucleotide-binding enzyme